MSMDMFPDSAIDYIVNHPETRESTRVDYCNEDPCTHHDQQPLQDLSNWRVTPEEMQARVDALRELSMSCWARERGEIRGEQKMRGYTPTMIVMDEISGQQEWDNEGGHQ